MTANDVQTAISDALRGIQEFEREANKAGFVREARSFEGASWKLMDAHEQFANAVVRMNQRKGAANG